MMCKLNVFKIFHRKLSPRTNQSTGPGSLFERAQIHRKLARHMKLVDELSELLPLDEVVSMLHETEINQWRK